MTRGTGAPLVQVKDLVIRAGDKVLVDHVSFDIDELSRTGLIGESGSGKTLTCLAIMGLLPDNLEVAGSIRLRGRELMGLSDRELVELRGNDMSMIFQEPMTALNPLHRIGLQVAEPLRIHQGMDRSTAQNRAVELLDAVGIEEPARRARSYPHELSGGQRQRAMIAMALACGPDLIIADEPTTALDVTVQQQVLELLDAQIEASNAALLLITHDLPVVSMTTEDVLVLRDGQMVESGATAVVFDSPGDRYTAELVAAVPEMSRSGTVAESGPGRLDPGPGPVEPGAPGSAAITVRDVSRHYRVRTAGLFKPKRTFTALDSVDLAVDAGETFGIVGESGSGKSTLARLIVGLDRPSSGSIEVAGLAITELSDLAELRNQAQMVFQDPMASLDPRLTVERIISEPLRALEIAGDHEARVIELLEAVALDQSARHRYPHEFSGGQRQRIAIARALAPNPSILVADEPVSALDMSVQTVTLDLLAELKAKYDLTMIFISHDLSVVADICERVAVLEAGRVVEIGPVAGVFGAPSDPYTQRLIDAIPTMAGASTTT